MSAAEKPANAPGRPLTELCQTDATAHAAKALLCLVDIEREQLGDFTDRTHADYHNLSARLTYLRSELAAFVNAERLPS